MRRDVVVVAGVTLLGLAAAGLYWKLRPEPVRSVQGIVELANGTPCPYARVSWESEGSGATGTAYVSALYSRAGHFSASHLPPGELRFRAEVPGGLSSPTVSATPGKNIRLVVPLGATLRLRTDPPEPYTSFEVRAVDAPPDAPVLRVTADRQDPLGRVFLGGLRADARYDAFIQVRSDRRAAVAHGISPGPKEAVLPLQPGKPIRGRVIAPSTSMYLTVSAVWGDRHIGTEADISDDSFDLPNLPAGRWRLRAWAYHPTTEELWEGFVDAEAGHEGVEIRLAPAAGP